MRRILSIAVAAALLPAIGCGKDTYTVKGRVTIDGKPVKKATVRFLPDNEQAPRLAWGLTNDNGEFTMSTFKPEDGVLPGVYRVTINNPENSPTPLGPPSGNEEDNAKALMMYRQLYEQMKKRPQVPGELPVLYGDLETTPLKFSVPADGGVATFDLKTDPSAAPK